MKLSSILFILTIVFSLGCKNTPKIPKLTEVNILPEVNQIEEQKTQESGCLLPADSVTISEFMQQMNRSISNDDVKKILNGVQIPFETSQGTYTEDEFIVSYLDILTSYFSKDAISKDEINDLEREEKFKQNTNTKNCYVYVIYNTFSELEFNVNFYINKINNKLKVVKIEMAG